MKTLLTIILTAASFLFGGCVFTQTGFINTHVPDGTLASIDLVVGATGGAGGTIHATNVIKANNEITLGPGGEFHMTLHDVVNPVFDLDVKAPANASVTLPLK